MKKLSSKSMSEAELQQNIIDLARVLGYKAAHFRGVRVQRKDGSVYYQTPVQADGAGFPDLVLAKEGRTIYVECKSEHGQVSPEQAEWLGVLAGLQVYVWRPEDWFNGHIENVLMGKVEENGLG